MRVLLVDDEKELVATLAERLALRDIYARWACTAEDALKAVDECEFDVAVLDVKIPGMSGLELKKIMERKCPETRFIFMTGHGSEADFKTGVAEAGLHYYLVKPVKLEVLVEKMKEVLQNEGEAR